MRVVPLTLLFFLTGCLQMQTPYYDPSFSVYGLLEAQQLRPVRVGEVILTSKDLNRISIRGNPMKSSVDDSYAQYIAFALKGELAKAKILAETSDLYLSVQITENDMDVGSGQAEAVLVGDVTVMDTVSGVELYRETVTGRHSWDSAFFGGIAIGRARENYPYVVKSFIRSLFQSEKFRAALKLPE